MNNPILFYLVAGVLVVGLLVWHYSRSRSLLHQWAETNHYQILSAEFRYFFRGPFFWTTSKSQTVYYIRIRDSEGHERSGWLRCGSFWAGLLSDKAEVRWDDEE